MQIVPSFANRYARNSTEAQFPSLWRGLVGCWMPSIGIQGSKFVDFSGTRNDAVISDISGASPWPRYSGNQGRRGALFAHVDNYGDVANPRKAGITGDISILVWIKRTGSLPTYDAMLSKSNGSEWDYLLYFNASTSHLRFFSSVGADINWTSTSTITDAKWHHVAVTRIGSAWSLYIDGKVDASGSDGTALSNNTYPLVIGRLSAASTTSGVDGFMDDIRLYNRGLSAQEIAISAAGYSPLTLREALRWRVGAVAAGDAVPVCWQQYRMRRAA